MLTEADRLKLQQLRLLAWSDDRRARDDNEDAGTLAATADLPIGAPETWTLTGGIELRPWQLDATDAWISARHRGTIKVVTGAGKTLLALAITERLQRYDPELRVAVVVPTIVLMEQWYATLGERSNLPVGCVGRLGGGHSDDFEDGHRILIAVLASARKELPRLVGKAGVGRHLLLVADECHRVGAPEMSTVLHTERAYSLGLSAVRELSLIHI